MSAPIICLGDIAHIEMGQAPKGDSYNDRARGRPLIAGASDFGDLTPQPSRYTDAPTKVSRKGDLIICIRATIGDLNFSDKEYCLGRGVAGLRPKSSKLDERYLWRALEANVPLLRSKGRGATFLQVSKADISELPIPFPPLDEQRRIAGILDQADALCRLRARTLDKLNTLSQAIFHEMFAEALKGKNFSFGSVVEEFRYGTSNKSGETGLPTLRIPNVIGGGIDTTEIKTVDVTDDELKRLRLIDGDVLFVRTNGNPDNVGRCAAFSSAEVANYDAQSNWIFASYLIRARLSDRINPIFAKTYFASQIGRAAVRERAKTSAGQYNINTQGLASLPFPDVARTDQDRFVEKLAAIEANSSPMKLSAEKMEEKFASLQYSAFRGEL